MSQGSDQRKRSPVTADEQAWIDGALEAAQTSNHPAAIEWRARAQAADKRAKRLCSDLAVSLTLDDHEAMYVWFYEYARMTRKPPQRLWNEISVLYVTG